MMATTNKTWMKPPTVELVTKPNIQRTMRMIAMVINIMLFLSVDFTFYFRQVVPNRRISILILVRVGRIKIISTNLT